MVYRNKHGLTRPIPAKLEREIRQRCGFGCVICGKGNYDYEHFDPDFKDALEHHPKGITLLCMQCNQKRARKLLSVETVRRANENPKCLSAGFANENFDFGVEPLEVHFGGLVFINCDTLIEVRGYPLLSMKPPDEINQPYKLSGKFADAKGDITLSITDNVWSAGTDNWDVEWAGPRVTIRNGLRDVSLILKAEPPHRLVVELLNMQFDGVFLRASADVFEISFDRKHWRRFMGCSSSDSRVGLAIG